MAINLKKIMRKLSVLSVIYGVNCLTCSVLATDQPGMTDLMDFLYNGHTHYKKFNEAYINLLKLEIKFSERQYETDRILSDFQSFGDALQKAEKINDVKIKKDTIKLQNKTQKLISASDKSLEQLLESFDKGIKIPMQTIRLANNRYRSLEEESLPFLRENSILNQERNNELEKARAAVKAATDELVKAAKVKRDQDQEKQIEALHEQLNAARKRAEQATAQLQKEASKVVTKSEQQNPHHKIGSDKKSQVTTPISNQPVIPVKEAVPVTQKKPRTIQNLINLFDQPNNQGPYKK